MRIRLHSQDYSEAVFETKIMSEAETYLRNSGFEWLGLTIDYDDNNNWRQRWGGRLLIKQDGTIEQLSNQDLLKHIMMHSRINHE